MGISLDGMGSGALLERFNLAMAQIARNIMDPNTDPEKARKIIITLTFKPDKNRKHVKTTFAVNISQAGPVAEETMMLVGQDLRTGRIEMNEYGSNQQPVRVAGESYPVTTEVIPPQSNPFDPETGEIIEPVQSQKPINLREVN
ncbi:hypothetical protein [Clostridium sp. HBUAS56010]|uniref:hypothetical protein n=1 Tax=Clostridium sp. HBUAS56010 TaxID=2571127 RepID=UPI00117753AD|nr:hypothetical protein [Clostridium sp. HBUAS56010]